MREQSRTAHQGVNPGPSPLLRNVLQVARSTQRGHRENQVLGPVLFESHGGSRVGPGSLDADHHAGSVAVMHDRVAHREPQRLGAGRAHRWRRPRAERAPRREVGVAAQETFVEVDRAPRRSRRGEVVDQLGRDLGEEAAGDGRRVLAPQGAASTRG